MGRFDKIQETPDFWTSALNSFGENYDRLIQAEEMNKQDERYNQQQSIANQERIKEQNRYDTEQEQIMFNQRRDSALSEHDKALNEYEIAKNGIGKDRPDLLEKLQKNPTFSKEYLIPKQDGTYEKRQIIHPSNLEYTSSQVKTKKQMDDLLDNWKDLNPQQKKQAWPRIKKSNQYFNMDLSSYEEDAKKAMSYDDNLSVLDSMSSFLPTGYDNEKWEKAKLILLKDGQVTDRELKLIAGDITTHITNQNDAKDFWTKFNSDIITARSKLELSSDPGTVNDLSRMSDIAQENLGRFYSGMGKTSSTNEEFDKKSESLSMELYNKNFNELTQEEKNNIFQRISGTQTTKPIVTRAGVGDNTKPDEETPLEEKVPKDKIFSPIKLIRNPVTNMLEIPRKLSQQILENPYKYAQKGLIPTEEFPFFKTVPVKEAIMNWKKSTDQTDLTSPRMTEQMQ